MKMGLFMSMSCQTSYLEVPSCVCAKLFTQAVDIYISCCPLLNMNVYAETTLMFQIISFFYTLITLGEDVV